MPSTFNIACFPDAQSWDQLSYALLHFKPATVYAFNEAGGSVFAAATLITSLDEVPGTLVLLAPTNSVHYPGTVPLDTFEHPESATYVFGPNDENLLPEHVGSATLDARVHIPTDTDDQMWNWTALAVTLYDRRVKSG